MNFTWIIPYHISQLFVSIWNTILSQRYGCNPLYMANNSKIYTIAFYEEVLIRKILMKIAIVLIHTDIPSFFSKSRLYVGPMYSLLIPSVIVNIALKPCIQALKLFSLITPRLFQRVFPYVMDINSICSDIR